MSQSRNKQIDVLKGIAIFMMVWGHLISAGKSFVYMFHMAVFIITSGYFYRGVDRSFLSLLDGIRRRVGRLYIPYVLYNVGLTVLFFLITKLPIRYAVVATFESGLTVSDLVRYIILESLMIKAGPWLAQSWFIRTLFHVSITFLLVDWCLSRVIYHCDSSVIEKEKIRICVHVIIGMVLLLLGWRLAKTVPQGAIAYNIERAMMSYILYALGLIFSRMPIANTFRFYTIRGVVFPVVMILASGVILGFMQSKGKINLMLAVITDPLYFLVGAILGWMFMMYISDFCIVISDSLSGFLSFAGKNSMYVLMLHFFVIWLLESILEGRRLGTAACTEPYVKFFVGCLLPLGVAWMCNKTKGKLTTDGNKCDGSSSAKRDHSGI